ncbi:pitrilysin family protein [Curvibacter sp. HBC61]|uniref:Pitrilysin family protein n=1 Tax=Curvibacter cyanobacteriorum TaxID=3026422 RepID=A0ABT5N1X1_9BURK|nr:pitrilysin family protein [Curvibacter sp. HBC61]MDD0839666.1 pitrilysin family protein [Curvibacter sp. HBC61]
MKRYLPLLVMLTFWSAPPLQAQSAEASAAPAAEAGSPQKDSTGVQQFTLRNGMTLIVKPDHRAPTVAHMLWVRVGSMDEVDGTSGVAHALEHMMFKGTPSLAPGEFSRRVAALGGRENAFTTRDYTGYYQQIPAARLEEVMKLEADRFANNQWADDEFRREIEVIKEERRMRTDDNPRARLYEALNAAAFVASPYHRPVVGWMSDLDSMTADDVRQFWRAWYSPQNAAVVIAGDVTPAQALALAQRYYEPIASRALPARKPRLEPQQVGLRRLDYKAPAEQAYVALAFKVPQLGTAAVAATATTAAPSDTSADDDALALTVLAAVLDGYPGARLERALTQGERRVADSAGAYNGLMGRGPQMFVLDGVPAAGQSPEAVEAALRAQVKRVAEQGISEAELQRVKTQWVASEVYKLDSVFNQANELGRYWVQGMPLDASERLIKRLRQVTAAQVQSVAARYFGDDQLTVATLRPQPLDPQRPRAAKPTGRHASP